MIVSSSFTRTGCRCTGISCYCAYGYSSFTNYNSTYQTTPAIGFSNDLYVDVTNGFGNEIFRNIYFQSGRTARAIRAFREAAKDSTPRAAAVPPRQPPPVSLALAAVPLTYTPPVRAWNEMRWQWRPWQQSRGREPISHRRRIRTWERNKDA